MAMLNHSLSTLLGQLESGAFGKLLHAEVSPSGRAELTEPLQERLRTSYWPRDGGRAGLPPALCQASWGPGTPLPGYQLDCAVLSPTDSGNLRAKYMFICLLETLG